MALLRLSTNEGIILVNINYDQIKTVKDLKDFLIYIDRSFIKLSFDMGGSMGLKNENELLSILGVTKDGSLLFLLGKFKKSVVTTSYVDSDGSVVPAGTRLLCVEDPIFEENAKSTVDQKTSNNRENEQNISEYNLIQPKQFKEFEPDIKIGSTVSSFFETLNSNSMSNFEFLTSGVYHWDRCIEKRIGVTKNTTFSSFMESVWKKFEEEITTPFFRLYAFPVDTEDINQRVLLESDDDLGEIIENLFGFNAEHPSMLLYVFNCDWTMLTENVMKSTSLNHTKRDVNIDTFGIESSIVSKVSRNSTKSLERKTVDNFTCSCCEVKGTRYSTQNVHIFEIKEGKYLIEEKEWTISDLNDYLASNFGIVCM
eukprot:gene10211-13738_t